MMLEKGDFAMRATLLFAVIAAALPMTALSAQDAKPAKPKKICRTEPQINTRLPGRTTCKTAAEWERDDAVLDKGALAIRTRVGISSDGPTLGR